MPYETIQSRADERLHPATFPVRLAEMCITLHGSLGSLVVLDPFLGIGISGVAALKCRVGKFIGFEIEQSYFDKAAARIGATNSGSPRRHLPAPPERLGQAI